MGVTSPLNPLNPLHFNCRCALIRLESRGLKLCRRLAGMKDWIDRTSKGVAIARIVAQEVRRRRGRS